MRFVIKENTKKEPVTVSMEQLEDNGGVEIFLDDMRIISFYHNGIVLTRNGNHRRKYLEAKGIEFNEQGEIVIK
jgi:hypothetical protein